MKQEFKKLITFIMAAFTAAACGFASFAANVGDNPMTGDTQGRYIGIVIAVAAVALVVVIVIAAMSAKKGKKK